MIALPSSGLSTYNTYLLHSLFSKVLVQGTYPGPFHGRMWALDKRRTVSWRLYRPNVVLLSTDLLSYHSSGSKHWFNPCCVWGHCWGMMSSEWRDDDATLNMTNTIYWHLQYKQDGGKDDVHLLFGHYISYSTHNLIVLPCALTEFMLTEFNFWHFLPPLRDSNQQRNKTSLLGWKRWCWKCLYVMLGYRHVMVDTVRVLTFQCLSHLSEEWTPHRNFGMWLYLSVFT